MKPWTAIVGRGDGTEAKVVVQAANLTTAVTRALRQAAPHYADPYRARVLPIGVQVRIVIKRDS